MNKFFTSVGSKKEGIVNKIEELLDELETLQEETEVVQGNEQLVLEIGEAIGTLNNAVDMIETDTSAEIIQYLEQNGRKSGVMIFKDSSEMLDTLKDGYDLYSPSLGKYLFVYNDAGSVCYYDISPNKMYELITEALKVNDYISAFLGPGGFICDDISYEYPPTVYSNKDLCEELYQVQDWVIVNTYKEEK
ncbi:MAG: hypothetical protein ACI37Z_01115 [Candidatus Gastranaerophilaceae bacterium]